MYELIPCPVCGKKPIILWDTDYEERGLGAWCSIQCKPFLRKQHLMVIGKGETWQKALVCGIEEWNRLASPGE